MRLTVVALAGALIPITLIFYLVLSRLLEKDASAVLRDRAAAASETIAGAAGTGAAEPDAEAVLDDTTWIFDASGAQVEQPTGTTARDAAAARSLARAPHETRLDTADLALLALPVQAADGRRLGTVVAGVSRQPFERAEHTALLAALTLDALVLVGGALITRRTVSAVLAPVSRMTAAAAEWGAEDVDRRFALGPPTDEITRLASTLDGLLGRLATSLGHERRLTAEIAHELRTPLARLRAEAEVALAASGRAAGPGAEDTQTQDVVQTLAAALENVVADVGELSGTIDTLLRTAASQPLQGNGADLEDAVRVAIEQAGLALAPTLSSQGGQVRSAPCVSVEPALVTRCLVPVLTNAITYGDGAVGVEVSTEGQWGVVRVTDDGPGFSRADVGSVLQPGIRGSAAAGRRGAGLGLPLALRLARSAGGDLTVHAPSGGGGGDVRVRFPLVTSATR